MSIKTVQQAFEQFEKDSVRVPSAQNDRAKDVHPDIRKAVEQELGELFNRAFLAGSYARRVQTVRLKDVDIIIVLNDPEAKFAASANAALERLREAAKTCELNAGTRKGVRAIKVVIDGEEFTVDLVAALEDPFGELQLACYIQGERDDWTPGRPKGQLDAHWQKNKETSGVFISTVRIVKYWNQRTKYNGKNSLPSYPAESILYHSMSSEADYDAAVTEFFRAAQSHLSIPSPTVPCPGAPGTYVDERLDDGRRKAALEKAQAALVNAEAALGESDPAEAVAQWRKVFGPAFPAIEDDTTALSRALGSGTALAEELASAPTRTAGGRSSKRGHGAPPSRNGGSGGFMVVRKV
jgi:hypothetical protein